MNRAGCPRCGDVIVSAHRHDYVACTCGGVAVDGGDDYAKRSFLPDCVPVELPTAADLLAFKLRHAGRHDEAVDVEDAHAVIREHTG